MREEAPPPTVDPVVFHSQNCDFKALAFCSIYGMSGAINQDHNSVSADVSASSPASNLHLPVCLLSRFSRVCLFATLWTVACQAPLSVGFSRQEYWSVLPFPSPGGLPDLGSNLHPLCLLHWQGVSLPLSYLGSQSVTCSVTSNL